MFTDQRKTVLMYTSKHIPHPVNSWHVPARIREDWQKNEIAS